MSTAENATPPGPQGPQGPPGPPPAQRRLHRSRTDRVIGGVCGGLGEYFGLDPVIFRIAFVVLVVLGGAGVLLYPVAWIVLPEEGHQRSIAEGWVRQGRHGRILPIALIVLGALILSGDLRFAHRDGGAIFAGGLVLIGVLLLRRHQHPTSVPPYAPPSGGPTPPAPPIPPNPPTPPTSPLTPPATPPLPPEAAFWKPPPPGAPPPPGDDTWQLPEQPTRRGPSLFSIVLSVLLIGGGVVGLLHAADAVSVSVSVFLAGALIFTGLAILASAWLGGTPGLIVVAVLLTIGLAIAAVVHAPLNGTWGNKRWVPSSLSEVRSRYRVGAGEAVIDLSHVALPPGGKTVRASVGAGHLRVVVPDRGRVTVDGHAGMGEVRLFDQHDDGWDVSKHTVSGSSDDGSLRLHLDVGAGQVEVLRAAA